MLKRIIQYLLAIYNQWREERDKRIADAARAKDDAKQAIDVIDKKLDSPDRSELDDRGKSLSDRAKDLGLVIAFISLFPALLFGQSAEERIATLSHAELKVYTQQLVDLARDQQDLIKDLQADLARQDARTSEIRNELEKVKASIEKLGAASEKSGFMKFIDWTLKIAPVVFAGAAATK